MKLSVISIALIPMLSLSAVQAAVYDVVEVGDVAEVRTTAAVAINDVGDVIFNGGISNIAATNTNSSGFTPFFALYQGDGRSYYDFPLDLEAIDFTSDTVKAALTEEQIADAINGITDASSLSILMSKNFANQPRGLALPYFKTTNENAQNVILRDFSAEPVRGNSEYFYGINNQSVAVGFASTPFTRHSFTPPTETVPEPAEEIEWLPEGPIVLGTIVKDGVVTTIPAPYQEMGGGLSLAYAINNQDAIVGLTSIGMSEEMKEKISSVCTNQTESEASCKSRMAFSNTTVIEPLNTSKQTGDLLQSNSYYLQAGAVWHFSGDTVSEPELLGFLGDKNTGIAFDGEEYNKVHYLSRPYDINDKGLVVGSSVYTDSDKEVRFLVGDIVKTGIYRTYHAALFIDNEAIPLVDESQWLRSTAIAINNNDIIVGGALKNFKGTTRSKMFIHDYNLGQTTFIDGFFDSSSTQVRDINDDNIIVGKAETFLTTSSVRRDRAFIMDLADNSFKDLNTYLGCNSPYTLIDATSINNQGEILATALVKKEQRDIKGDLVLDSSGAPVLDTVTTTVKLTPIANGEPESCSNDDTSYKRKSGSFSFAWLLGFIFIGWRRLQR